jgi:pimeloyl-ACP methyl ester carboxylesterase
VWAGIAVSLVVLVACVLIGLTWARGSRAKAELTVQYPPPGQIVDVGGYRLHINCQGEGRPTVVIDAAAGDFSAGWAEVQREVARFTRVCAYDRAGLGWSERSPNPPTARHAVEDLHSLLSRADIEGPYVLVGHSLGGLYARLYAHEYPADVAGMILVDASHEEQFLRFPEAYRQASEKSVQQIVMGLRVPQLLNSIGVLALSPDDYPDQFLPPLPESAVEPYKAVIVSDTRYFETLIGEYASLEESMAQVRAAQIASLGDIPLVVLTRGLPTDPAAVGMPAEVVEQADAVWDELQVELAALSSNGEQVIAQQCGHYVHLDQPELVIDAIRTVVEAARR